MILLHVTMQGARRTLRFTAACTVHTTHTFYRYLFYHTPLTSYASAPQELCAEYLWQRPYAAEGEGVGRGPASQGNHLPCGIHRHLQVQAWV